MGIYNHIFTIHLQNEDQNVKEHMPYFIEGRLFLWAQT